MKASIGYLLAGALLVAAIYSGMDLAYARYNHYFAFTLTPKEFWFKLYPIAVAILLIPKKALRKLFYAVTILFSLIDYIYFDYFGKHVSAIDFYLFFQNIGETFDALGAMSEIVAVPLMIAFSGIVLLYSVEHFLGEKAFHAKAVYYVILLFVAVWAVRVFYIVNIPHREAGHNARGSDNKLLYALSERHSFRNFYVALNHFLFGIVPHKMRQNRTSFAILPPPEAIGCDLNRTIVLIIGESMRADTLSLEKGNPLTPNLQKLKNDKNFFCSTLFAGGTMTKVSVATLINRIKYPDTVAQIVKGENALFSLAKRHGFHTAFISAQTANQIKIIRDSLSPKSIDLLLCRDDFSRYITPCGRDEDLLTMVHRLQACRPGHFVVLQQRGSHTPYAKNYPASFARYTPYENCALYTDYTLSQIFRTVAEKAEGEYFVIYVSDHGELLGEGGKRGHGHLEKEVYRVPLMVYTNTENRELKEALSHIRCHYDLSNYLLKLLGYKGELSLSKTREIYILNADLEGYSGYCKVTLHKGEALKIERCR